MTIDQLDQLEQDADYRDYAIDLISTHPEDYGIEESDDYVETYGWETYRDLDVEDRKDIARQYLNL